MLNSLAWLQLTLFCQTSPKAYSLLRYVKSLLFAPQYDACSTCKIKDQIWRKFVTLAKLKKFFGHLMRVYSIFGIILGILWQFLMLLDKFYKCCIGRIIYPSCRTDSYVGKWLDSIRKSTKTLQQQQG